MPEIPELINVLLQQRNEIKKKTRAPYARFPMFMQTEFFEIVWTCHPSKNDVTEVSRMGGKAKSEKSLSQQIAGGWKTLK